MEHTRADSVTAFSLDTFSRLAHRYTQPLHVFLCGFVHDPELARDLLQDVFCAAWDTAQQGVPPFNGGDEIAMRRWLYRVAYRRAIDTYRHKQVIRWESLDELHADELLDLIASTPFEEVVVESEAMGRALAVLHVEDVASLLLTVVQSFTIQEAATIVGCSPAAMGKRIGRAKQRLLSVYLAQNPASLAVSPEEPAG